MFEVIIFGFLGGIVAKIVISGFKSLLKYGSVQKSKSSDNRTVEQIDTDELVTTILPVINSNR